MYRPPSSPYCGFSRDSSTQQLSAAEGACHLLVSAPTETGKTRGVLAPAAVLWGGPAVCVSPKDDLMWLVCQRRWGPKQVIDLRPDYSPVYPTDAQVRSFDPTALISTPDQAVTAANTMMQMSAVGLGSSIDQVSDAGIWEANTEGPLAAMLYAASPCGHGKGIDWVLLAVDNLEQDDKDPDAPGWHSAARQVASQPLFRNALMRTLAMEPKQRDSIALTMRKAVTPWMRLGLRGVNAPCFDDAFLSDPDATLFILAPAEGSIAGAAVTLLDHLVRSWRGKTARKEMLHRLLMVIDEATNVAPMPALRRYVSEGRGLGVNLVLAVQASCQFDTIYGSAYARELRATFPAALIMYGADEMEMLQRGEQWSRETTRRQESFDQATGAKTLSSQLGPSLDYRRLLPQNRGQARLLRRGTAGITTELPDWPDFLNKYDRAVKTLLQQPDRPGLDKPTNMWEWIAARHRRAADAITRR
ncbi:type IV secretory system conjugative DNA transfer family protein [Mycobacterium intracellulare]|uniref:Type IV secretory system conjugative DNA transfer family protein n=1 Tax=Mycobacterium intracellulare TaxID=1767 RepID=A0AAE4RL16_MYCIT|nr:type IV secretory system conjugative DNA transfer family protein [Mycobacterium intracellulare]MDV6979280.1 type IV secretory system conjugative DNA transfer family protein [Mycobacterium intracellulare]MDV6984753.1 type IV secretory system conjugative DNA transfer family protein [Mycobacterium intracellulare]MDV7014857.1 type IV secretory system conjugative DNA transfer family protein [Mycobacterium intracellulare]MDV7030541.1 type IV secretory system conjugative DNA transfer family protein